MRFLSFSNHEKGPPRQETACSTILLKLAANGMQHVFEKWVERYNKCIACQGRYFEKETVIAPPGSSDLELQNGMGLNLCNELSESTHLPPECTKVTSNNDIEIKITGHY
jgi:hypothetical protein